MGCNTSKLLVSRKHQQADSVIANNHVENHEVRVDYSGSDEEVDVNQSYAQQWFTA